jgi:alanyl-tRNA synthetase
VVNATVKAVYVGLRDDIKHTTGFVESVNADTGRFGVILDRTNFYAEKGGQIYDTGLIKTADGQIMQVTDVQVFGGYVLHIGVLRANQTLTNGAAVTLEVDYERRALAAKNHTTTHLLNYALRKVINEADQQGSLVDAEKARFDFNHNKALTLEQLQTVQSTVQQFIDENAAVVKKACPKGDALEISALRAMFGQTYPSIVRVVAVVPASENFTIDDMVASPKDQKWFDTSVEFCGGTHLDSCGEAGRFVIVSEGSIKSGTRRIVAFTHDKAAEVEEYAQELQARFEAAAKLVGPPLQAEIKDLNAALTAHELPALLQPGFKKSLAALNTIDKKWKKARLDAMAAEAQAAASNWAAEKKGAPFLLENVTVNGSGKLLKKIAGKALKELKVPVLLYSVNEAAGNVSVFGTCPPGHALNAKDWVTSIVSLCGGKCGGNASSSTGAGRDISNLSTGVEAATKLAAGVTSQ